MIFIRASHLIVRFVNYANKNVLSCSYLSTDRSETISSALKQFYLKVHPDLFTQYPKEKVILFSEYKKVSSERIPVLGC